MAELNEDELKSSPGYALAMRHAASGAVDPQAFIKSQPSATPTATATPLSTGGGQQADFSGSTTPKIKQPTSVLGPVGQAAATGQQPAAVAGIPRQAPSVDRAPPVGPPGTAQLSRILALKAAGQPYVDGGFVHNQPAGTAGMDFNTNTGEWIPQSTVGTISGRPAPEVIAEEHTRNVQRRAEMGGLPRVQTAGPTPPVGGTQAVNITPTNYFAKGGPVRRPAMCMQDGGVVDTIRDRNRDLAALTNDGDFAPAPAKPTPAPTPQPQKDYAIGGKVGGPPVKKDIVPAMLTPGENVLNEYQQKQVRVMPNFRSHMSPDEGDAMASMNLPRMRPRNQKAINPVNRFAKAA